MAHAELHKIIDHIVKRLFEPDTRRLKQWADLLCNRNQEVKGGTCNGFLYGGVFYRRSTIEGHIPDKRAIDPSLFPEMDAYLKDESIMRNDLGYIRQALFMLLEPCMCNQDFRDALPDCLLPDMPEPLPSLNRQREMGFTISDNPRAVRQVEKVLPMIQIYATARLIF